MVNSLILLSNIGDEFQHFLKNNKIPLKVRNIQFSVVQHLRHYEQDLEKDKADNRQSESEDNDDEGGRGLREEDDDDEEEIENKPRGGKDEYDDEKYSDEEDADDSNNDEVKEESEEEKFKLINMIKSFPETLEGFTFVNRDKNNPSNLEEKYGFTKFIVALIKMGINELGFSNISFDGDGENSNKQALKNIFMKVDKNSIKYLKFNNCSGVTSLEKILYNLDQLHNLAFSQCNINDDDLDNIFKMIQCFGNEHMTLHSLSMNYNNITDKGIKNFTDKISENDIHINQINVYNNKIKDKKYGEPKRIFFC